MADKTIDSVKKSPKKENTKTYILLVPFNHGSNKDGSAKHSYKAGDSIELSKKQAEVCRKQNLIK